MLLHGASRDAGLNNFKLRKVNGLKIIYGLWSKGKPAVAVLLVVRVLLPHPDFHVPVTENHGE